MEERAIEGTVGAMPDFIEELKQAFDKLDAVVTHPSNAVSRDGCLAQIEETDFEMGDLRVLHQALMRFLGAFKRPAKAA